MLTNNTCISQNYDVFICYEYITRAKLNCNYIFSNFYNINITIKYMKRAAFDILKQKIIFNFTTLIFINRNQFIVVKKFDAYDFLKHVS